MLNLIGLKIKKIFCRVFILIIPKIDRDNWYKHCNESALIRGPYSYVGRGSEEVANVYWSRQHRRAVAATEAVQIDEAYLIGPCYIPFDSMGRLIVEPIKRREVILLEETIKKLGLIQFIKVYLSLLGARVVPENTIVGDALFQIPRIRNKKNIPHYGHWFGEHIPQYEIFSFESCVSNRIGTILINDSAPEWQLKSIALYAGEKTIKQLSDNNTITNVKKLWISTIKNVHSRAYEFDPLHRTWMRNKIRSLKVADRITKKLFIHRQADSTRRIRNFTTCSATLSRFGYVEHDPYSLTFDEDIHYMQCVDSIIGPFGSNLIKVLFAPYATSLIEISSRDTQTRPVFGYLSLELGISYRRVGTEETNDDDDECWLVPVNNLCEIIIEGEL